MSGKGDKIRPYSKPKYDQNYDSINWSKVSKPVKKKFKKK